MTDNNPPLSKADFETGITALESRLNENVRDAETQLKEYIDERTHDAEARLKEYIDERTHNAETQLKEYIDERTHDAETRLLRGFADYQQSQTTRFRHMKADLGNLNAATDERLAALEDRITNVEKRLIEKHI